MLYARPLSEEEIEHFSSYPHVQKDVVRFMLSTVTKYYSYWEYAMMDMKPIQHKWAVAKKLMKTGPVLLDPWTIEAVIDGLFFSIKERVDADAVTGPAREQYKRVAKTVPKSVMDARIALDIKLKSQGL